ncbi:hypothetical protein [Saezia sanguinis]|uniref:hypothetical protein n=1 Tax=Saezia sanguinis TaxID=1965230 RepID=UPI0030402892
MGKRTSDPTGVVGCTEECKSTAMVCMLNHTIVEFRPNRAWRGEFGFDWLRIDDSPATQHEIKYEDCILDGYKDATSDLGSSAAAYTELKKEYFKLNVNSHRVAPKNEYFVPWMNLYSKDISDKINDEYKKKSGSDLVHKPPFEAELRLIINVQGDTKPKALEIVFPSEYFTIEYPTGAAASGSPITIPATGVAFAPNSPGINHDLPDTIKVKCIKEYSTNQYIDIWAHHYQHTQVEIDQLEQENKQLNDTDIPALEQEKAALEAEAQTLQEQVTTQEAQVVTQQATVSQLEAEITALEAQCAAKKTIYQTIESQLQAFSLLSDEQKQATDNPDFQKLNLPGEREKDQAKVDQLKAEVAQLEQQIAQKKTQLEAPQKQLEDMQKQLEAKKAELEEKKNQSAAKQQEIEQKQEQVTKNTEEMNKMQGKSLAGKLCVCPNNSKHRKELDIVVIKVKLDINATGVPSLGRNLSAGESKSFYDVMYQSLIYPTFTTQRWNSTTKAYEDIWLDLRADLNFRAGGTYIDAATGQFIDDATIDAKYPHEGTHRYLRAKFEKDVGKYRNSIHVFMFGESSYFAGGMGVVQKIGGAKNLIMTMPIPNASWDYVVAHEALHCLSLYHTHRDSNPLGNANQKYVYHHGQHATSHLSAWNIMSYRMNSYYTWKWQWDLMRKNI